MSARQFTNAIAAQHTTTRNNEKLHTAGTDEITLSNLEGAFDQTTLDSQN